MKGRKSDKKVQDKGAVSDGCSVEGTCSGGGESSLNLAGASGASMDKSADGLDVGVAVSREQLAAFMRMVDQKVKDGSVAAIYVLSALNLVLNRQDTFQLLDEELKELARKLWLWLEVSGLQLRRPPVLFGVAS